MGNSPSVGLGGGSAHSSRDVRIVNPEKEVDRPTSASRAPTHNEYTELPASLKHHMCSVSVWALLPDLNKLDWIGLD